MADHWNVIIVVDLVILQEIVAKVVKVEEVAEEEAEAVDSKVAVVIIEMAAKDLVVVKEEIGIKSYFILY